jgi:hypothetical protein
VIKRVGGSVINWFEISRRLWVSGIHNMISSEIGESFERSGSLKVLVGAHCLVRSTRERLEGDNSTLRV